MNSPNLLICILTVLLCYIWWWIALTIVRIEQIKHGKQHQRNAQEHSDLVGGIYNNKNPRDQQLKLNGKGQRAVSVMANHQEQFGFFIGAIFCAFFVYLINRTDQDVPEWITVLSCIYCGSRFFHMVFYVYDYHLFRSICFALGAGCLFTLYIGSIASVK